MLYHLFTYLDSVMDVPGAGLFQYISFRAGMSLITSLVIGILFGKRIIEWLQLKQVGEIVRDLGLEGQMNKQGTPTMGGLIILAAILIPTLLFADLTNIYTQMMLLVTVWLGAIGFIDDYIKVFKKNKEGLAGRFKVIGQVGVGIIVGSIMWWHPDVTIKDPADREYSGQVVEMTATDGTVFEVFEADSGLPIWEAKKSSETTVPFMKDNSFDYERLVAWMGDWAVGWGWLAFIPLVILIVTAVSNGANLTDGIDGLATGSSAIIGLGLAVLAYVSSNIVTADYLNIHYIPRSEELVVFIAAFVGGCIAFLWYNAFPAQVFMGDTGSLALGGIIAAFAIAIRKELLLPVLCGIFLIENLSVVLQVGWFKYTKRKTGEGRRIFLMAPLHHHYQKQNIPESKITARFWIVGILLAVVTIVTLKVR
ncbi:MAG: phospho-N-acetylmuramoyl-pentapeptide-transferase [Bacteroidota bacterium]|jgi:phospho-N-acetylmuramoyl-pentapeptide-transferase|nr:phospho-N-acetylmuramoyl-pentapeptide-transferase [Bacteroidota bacterium]MEE3164021.1 phospho-N-acetylmuramoyl-pentapeptide-transferase [Bacteroidota bacterium]HBE11083.1 phospho-N-acetylmuramoyl-pentapeptide-transferase [Flavobacteriales bacterium]|tara:strand:- start:211 stop:1479 length:1269 start_codon:yes stop_codon:yes gene_type:complete